MWDIFAPWTTDWWSKCHLKWVIRDSYTLTDLLAGGGLRRTIKRIRSEGRLELGARTAMYLGVGLNLLNIFLVVLQWRS